MAAPATQATSATAPTKPITSVTVHPLVLLSTVDHYHRTILSPSSKARVIGILLGEVYKGKVDVTNSYAIPFEEDENNSKIWFVDHNYHENMSAMLRKINAKEQVVGWYSTGPKLRENDLDIHEVLKRYTPNPVLVIIDVRPVEDLEIPTKAYITIEDVREDGTPSVKFEHIPSDVGALEAEEVGVEHLLRDIKDTSVSTLANKLNMKILSLKSLLEKISEMNAYLENVLLGKLPVNHIILHQIQDIFNLLPNLSVEELIKSFSVKTNDMMLVIYLSSLIRAVLALHNLIRNKLTLRDAERKQDNPEQVAKEAKDKAAADKKGGNDKDKKDDKKAAPQKK